MFQDNYQDELSSLYPWMAYLKTRKNILSKIKNVTNILNKIILPILRQIVQGDSEDNLS